MYRVRGWVGRDASFRALALIAVALVSSGLFARTSRADEIDDAAMAYRRVVGDELSRQSPEAAKLLAKADEDADAGKDFDAIDEYAAAAKLVPDSPHPPRRLCSMNAKLRKRTEAISKCREALAKRDDSVQQSALAFALLVPPTNHESDLEAARLAEQSLGGGDEAFGYIALCQASLNLQDPAGLAKCTKGLERVAPSSPTTHELIALRAATEERYADAKESIRKARALGAKDLDPLEARVDQAIAANQSPYGPVWTFVEVWASLLAFVVVMGFSLSALTRSAAQSLPAERTGHAQGAARALRIAYRFVLWLACLLFYLSLPIMIASVVLLAGGLVYAAFMVGRIPVQLLLVVCLVAFVTVVATVKSLFVKTDSSDPGTRLDLDEHPKLRDVLVEVATKVGTRRVDKVFMTSGTEFGVFKRGGIWSRLRGAEAERCLIIGAGVLKGMRLTEFKAVLAHEYGHFQNEDTAGGGFALAVRRSTFHLILGLAQGGAARWYNPAWWMARGFHVLFIRISHGASRLQEVLADRWAAFSYGAQAFEGGLEHVIRRDVEFAAFAEMKVNEALKEKSPILNLYRGGAKATGKQSEIEQEVSEQLSKTSSDYDSHPPPRERFMLVRRLDAPTPEGEDLEALAWGVFEDRKGLEREMTRSLLSRLEQRHGVSGLVAS